MTKPKSESSVAITGECLCGAVIYEISGNLRDARSCHCSTCRKAFSAQGSSYALVDSKEFTWLSGESLLTSYVNKEGFGLQFCQVCGSTLCGTYRGKIHGVTLGCVNGDPEVEIGMHIHVGAKAKWEIIPDGIPQYEEEPPEDT